MENVSTMTVAIIDDSTFMRRMVRSAVAENFPQARLLEFSDGEQAVAALPSASPDLILLDLLMPRMTGQETLARLKELGVTAPVIVVTADVQSTVRERVRELGARGFIQKPITYDKLKAVLLELLPS